MTTRDSSTAPSSTPTEASGLGARCNAAVTPCVAVGVPALGDGEADEERDGATLPDADGVGSTVGPGGEDAPDDGRPVDGVVPTSTTRTDGTPCTGATPGDGEGELLGERAGAGGLTVTVTTGPGGPAADGNAGTSSSVAPATEKPPAATAHR